MSFHNKTLLKLIIPALFLTANTSTNAAEFAAELGLHVGGDTLVTAIFTNGDVKTVTAGGGLSLAIGAKFDISDDKYIKSLIGTNSDTITATNGSVDWVYVPVDVMFYKKTDKWDYGIGISYHMNPNLSTTGAVNNIDIDYKNSLGISVQADYQLKNDSYFGFKYTIMSYKSNSGITNNGNSLGLMLGAYF